MSYKPTPIREEKRGIETKPRVPHVEPLVPRLQREHDTYAIGFTADLISPEPEDYYEE